MKISLLGLDLPTLQQHLKPLDIPAFTAKQIIDWIYKKNCTSINDMTNISLKNRQTLDQHFILGKTPPTLCRTSSDGTKKYLFPTSTGKPIESAYIPEKDRATLCISSQVGCRMGCKFCYTAKQLLSANLSAADILNQLLSLPEYSTITNLVFMGMGEPFDNQDALFSTLTLLTKEPYLGMASKRITVSTAGVLPGIQRFMEQSDAHLAISLHHPDPVKRKLLMPIENKYPIKDTLQYLKSLSLDRHRRISFEYIMLHGYNDSDQDIKALLSLLNGLRCRINLIPFHPYPDAPYTPSSPSRIQTFADALNAKGLRTTIRKSRGMDIEAACGLLSTKTLS